MPGRYHVYALDQRGHGDSSKPACCYTQGDFSGDVVAFMDALGIAKASIVGHSMGSLIAHKVAVDHPTRVDKLVLVGSAPTVAGNEVALGLKEAVDTLVDPVDPAFVSEFQSSTFYRPIPASYLATLVSESRKVPAAIWQQALDGLIAEDHASELPGIRACRTAIFWGDQDVFFGFADESILDAEIPRSTLYVYPQTGHGLHAEAPKEFVKDLVRFLR
jgi:pimeloyl-ACP methyl ester carboxylesterase